MKSIRIRALLYSCAAFLTPVIDKVGPILEKNEWPTGPRIVWSVLLGVAAAVITLRAYYDGSVERAKNPSPAPALPPATFAVVLLIAALAFSGCATKFIDKVSQTRAGATKVGYQYASEYNAWLRPRTNNPAAYNTTYTSLMAGWTNVDNSIRLLGDSAQILKLVELEYRNAPTNQAPVVAALAELAKQADHVKAVIEKAKQ